MRRVGAGTVAALLGLSLAAAAAQAQPPVGTTAALDQGGWWSSLFGGKPKLEPVPPTEAPRLAAPNLVNRARELDRLQEAIKRRQEVCDRLSEIAAKTNDAALREEASRLEDLAWKLYEAKSTRLLGTAKVTVKDLEPVAPIEAPKPPARYAVRRTGLLHQSSGGEGEQP